MPSSITTGPFSISGDAIFSEAEDLCTPSTKTTTLAASNLQKYEKEFIVNNSEVPQYFGCQCEKNDSSVALSASDQCTADSDSDDSQDEGLSLSQVLHSLELYKRKSVEQRNRTALRNIALSYHLDVDRADEISTEHVKQIDDLLHDAEDYCCVEVALLLCAELCRVKKLAQQFLSLGIMILLFEILDTYLCDVHCMNSAAAAIKQVCSHHLLSDLWLDFMLSRGLNLLLEFIGAGNIPSIRHACANIVVTLACYQDVAILILDHAMPTLMDMKKTNSDCKEIYLEILSELVLHTDYTRATVLDIDTLPTAISMMKTGPCKSQKQGLLLLSALTRSESSIKVMLDKEIVPVILSAMCYANCKKVRCESAHVMSELLAVPRASFQKQILIQVDKFFRREQQEAWIPETSFVGENSEKVDVNLNRAKYKHDTPIRLHNAITQLTEAVLLMLKKEARIEFDDKHCVSVVYLTPCIDIDLLCLCTIKHLVSIIINLGQLKVNRIKVKRLDTTHMDQAELKNILKETVGPVNPVIIKNLINSGVLFIIDLLHTYTIKLQQILGVPITLPNILHDGNSEADRIKRILDSWANATEEYNKKKANIFSMNSIFQPQEQQLILCLLQFCEMLAVSSHDPVTKISAVENAEREIHKYSNPSKKSKHVAHREKIDNFDKKDDCPACTAKATRLQEARDHVQQMALTPMQLYKQELTSELGTIRRIIRLKIYEAGIIESCGPWVKVDLEIFKSKSLRILQCVCQPVAEKPITTSTTEGHVGEQIKNQQSSVKEKKHAVLKAFHQMSEETNRLMTHAMNIMENKDEPFLDGKINTTSTACHSASDLTVAQHNHLKPLPPKKLRPQSAKLSNSSSNGVSRTRFRPQSAKTKITEERLQNDMNTARPTSAVATKPFLSATKSSPGNLKLKPPPHSVKKSTVKKDKVPRAILQARQFRWLRTLPWKCKIDRSISIGPQCQLRVAEVCGQWIITGMLNRDEETRRHMITFLTELIHIAQNPVTMQLSEYGVMPQLIDFLRISESDVLYEIMGLTTVQLLCNSDQRLRQLFNCHGGSQLLISMRDYTSGPLKQHVSATLKSVIKGKSEKSERKSNHAPDIWDHLQRRWQTEDKVRNLLSKPADSH